MAFSIYIYEKDVMLYQAVKKRLSHYFPQAYIINPFENERKHRDVSEFLVILYDGRQYRKPVSEGSMPCTYIDLFEANEKGFRLIDCSRISELIRSYTGTAPAKNDTYSIGKSNLLLSYAYIDERELFIKKVFNSNTGSDFTLRLDLMSGIRMPSSFKTGMDSGSLTDLISRAGSKAFTKDMILDYLNPDSLGFLTPGKPQRPDDVFDVDFNNILSLLDNFQMLCHSKDSNSDGLIVCEGWRTTDLISMAKYCDKVHILLPERMCDEEKGMVDFINNLKRNLDKDTELKIHYCEDYRKDFHNEKAGIRT